MKAFSVCEECGEYREDCLIEDSDGILCFNCTRRGRLQKQRGTCFWCGRENMPVEQHHPLGRKYHDGTLDLCRCCHAALHKHKEMEQAIALLYAVTLVKEQYADTK